MELPTTRAGKDGKIVDNMRFEAERRLALLLEASQVFAEGGLNLQNVVDRISHHLAERVGDACCIRLSGERNGKGGRVTFSTWQAARDDDGSEIAERLSTALSELSKSRFYATIVEQGQSALITASRPEEMSSSLEAEQLSWLERSHLHGVLIVPLRVRGRVIGMLGLSRAKDAWPYTHDDRQLVEQLASRAALAIDNARLYSAEQAARREAELAMSRASRLMAITSALSEAVTPAQVAAVIADQCVAALGAQESLIFMVNYEQNNLVLIGHHGVSLEAVEEQRVLDTDADHVVCTVLRNGEPAFCNPNGELCALPLMVEGRKIGVMSVCFERAHSFDEETWSFAVTLARQCAQALDRARLYDVERRSREQAALLVEAGTVLASSLDPETTLRTLVRLAVPTLGDLCAVDVVTESGDLKPVAVAHVDRAQEELVRELRQKNVIRPNDTHPAIKAVRTGKPQVRYEIPNTSTKAMTLTEEQLRLAVTMGATSAVFLPLLARGKVLGVLTLGQIEDRYAPGDVAFLQEFARRAALSLDNARLYEAEQRERCAAQEAAERTRRLQLVTAALSEALTPAQVADAVVGHAVDALGAKFGAMARLSEDGREIELAGERSLPEELVGLSRRFPVNDDIPVAETVLRGEHIWISSFDEYQTRYSKGDQILKTRFGIEARVYLPLKAEGRMVGVLALFFTSKKHETEEELAFLSTLANQCAIALERARLYEAERQAHADAEAAQQRLAFIAEATPDLLNSALDSHAAAEAAVRLLVPELATSAVLATLEDDGAIQNLAVSHTDQSSEELIRSLGQRYPIGLSCALGDVIESGGSEIIDLSQGIDFSAEERQLLELLPCRSALLVSLNARGQTLGVLCLLHAERTFDTTDLAVAEEIARRVALALDNARLYGRLEAASRLKDEFLGIVSHELRTPLNAILGWARMLRMGAVKEGSQARALETIERNAVLQAQLVEDLMDASRIITGKLGLEVKKVDLARVVEAAVDSVNPAASAKHIKLHLIIDPSVGLMRGDPGRLQQVVWNLLTNAIKFSPKGGSIDVTLVREDDSARIMVRDEGEGIAPAFLPHVFDRFRQGDGSTTRKHGGLGLGLSIVRHLAEAHGGTVRVESAGLGKGATFTVQLPLPAPLSEEAAPRSHTDRMTQEPPVSHALEKIRVVLIEDEADSREIIKQMLQLSGAEVETAANVPEAMEQLQHSWPDILVSDIGMPEEDGYALIKKVHALEAQGRARLPSIALTAYATAEDRQKTLGAGYDVHMPKPVDPSELVKSIVDLLRLSAR